MWSSSGSWWRYRGRLDDGSDNSTHDLTFDEFARLYVDGDPTAPTPRGRPGQFLTIDDVVEVDGTRGHREVRCSSRPLLLDLVDHLRDRIRAGAGGGPATRSSGGPAAT